MSTADVCALPLGHQLAHYGVRSWWTAIRHHGHRRHWTQLANQSRWAASIKCPLISQSVSRHSMVQASIELDPGQAGYYMNTSPLKGVNEWIRMCSSKDNRLQFVCDQLAEQRSSREHRCSCVTNNASAAMHVQTARYMQIHKWLIHPATTRHLAQCLLSVVKPLHHHYHHHKHCAHMLDQHNSRNHFQSIHAAGYLQVDFTREYIHIRHHHHQVSEWVSERASFWARAIDSSGHSRSPWLIAHWTTGCGQLPNLTIEQCQQFIHHLVPSKWLSWHSTNNQQIKCHRIVVNKPANDWRTNKLQTDRQIDRSIELIVSDPKGSVHSSQFIRSPAWWMNHECNHSAHECEHDKYRAVSKRAPNSMGCKRCHSLFVCLLGLVHLGDW